MEKNQTKTPHKPKLTSIVSIILVAVTLLLCILAFIVIFNVGQGRVIKVFGKCIMRVATASMEPGLQVGDFIHIGEIDSSSLKKGDIIAFYSKEADTKDLVIVHRILEKNENGKFITKGDANTESDKKNIDNSQIVGKYEGKSEILIWLSGFGDFRKLAILSIMIIVVIIAMFETRTIMSLGKKIKEESYEEKMRKAIEEEKKRLAMEDKKKEEE